MSSSVLSLHEDDGCRSLPTLRPADAIIINQQEQYNLPILASLQLAKGSGRHQDERVDCASPKTPTTPTTQKPIRLLQVVTSTGIPSFPFRLHDMLDNAESKGFAHIVSWLGDAKSFKVHDNEKFTERILPAYFEGQTQYKSFQRQLNIYGFYRHLTGPNKGAYTHKLMVRGQPEACRFMVRTKIKNRGIHSSITATRTNQDALTTVPHHLPNKKTNSRESVKRNDVVLPSIANNKLKGCFLTNSDSWKESTSFQATRSDTFCSTAVARNPSSRHPKVVVAPERPSVSPCPPRHSETNDAINKALLEAKEKLLAMLLQTSDSRIISAAMRCCFTHAEGEQVDATRATLQELHRPAAFSKRRSLFDWKAAESSLNVYSQVRGSSIGTTGLGGSSLRELKTVDMEEFFLQKPQQQQILENWKVQEPCHGTFDEEEDVCFNGIFARNSIWDPSLNDPCAPQDQGDHDDINFEPLPLLAFDHGEDESCIQLENLFEI